MKIAVLVDLKLSKKSGGHVKYWERISKSLIDKKNEVDLSIFFLGDDNKIIFISENIRYIVQKPIISSNILRKFGIDADSTDLFPINPFLLLKLKKFDLIHTTDQFFSMSRTAKLASRLWSIPLTTSIHTDTPPYSRYYVEKIIKNYFSFLKIDTFLIKKLKIPEYYEKKMFSKIYHYIKKVDHAMVADRIYSPNILSEKTGNQNISKLQRGIDKKIFFINSENKRKIFDKYKIDRKDKLLFFSGRVHELKGAIHLAKIHSRLLKLGHNISTVLAGEGIHAKECILEAPNKLFLLGYLSTNDIADLYRSCDLFVFPSRFEIGPNVVIEAKACGAVCVVSPSGGGKRILRPNYDGVVINKFTVEEWVKKISDLLSNNDKTKQIKNYLKSQANESWDQIFFRDLVPYWKKTIRLKNEKNTDISTSS
mgnify:CR=1 FL=1